MSKKYDLKELHELTEKDREEIYRYAIKRSEEILAGPNKQYHDDKPTPIYGAPAGPEYIPHQTIKEWNRNYGPNAYKDIYLVKQLRQVLLDDDQIADVLDVLDNVCPDCWNNHLPCYCENGT